MNKRPTVPAPNATPRRPAPAPAPKRTPKEEGEKEYMKKKYPFNTYAKGGKASDKAGRALVKKSADTMGRAMPKKACGGKMKGYAKGGSVAARADGVAKKGHTRGKVL